MSLANAQRLAVFLAVAAVASAQPAADRRTHAWIEDLRLELALACRGQPAELIDAVAKDLVAPAHGDHALPLARALARVRGVVADRAFVFRHGVQCFATPEICDVGEIRQVHLTMHVPFAKEPVGVVGFVPRILAADGREVWRGSISDNTAMEDLLRLRATVAAPLSELADGEYRVEVDVSIDGQPPRPGDPRPTTRFYVLRGFPERAARLEQAFTAIKAQEGISADDLQLAAGAWEPVRRTYYWESEVPGRADSVQALVRAERVAENLRRGKPAWDGLHGWVRACVETGPDEQARLEVRLPPDTAPRPLLLFVTGTPAWAPAWARPPSPDSTHPRWLRRLLEAADFDAAHRFQIAVMESPGRFHSSSGALRAVVARLRRLFPADQPTVLVGEREGAAAVTGALLDDLDLAAGVVLIAGGSMARGTLERSALRRMLLVPGFGHPANVNLLRIADQAKATKIAVRTLPPQPWCLALGLCLDEVADTVRAASTSTPNADGRRR